MPLVQVPMVSSTGCNRRRHSSSRKCNSRKDPDIDADAACVGEEPAVIGAAVADTVAARADAVAAEEPDVDADAAGAGEEPDVGNEAADADAAAARTDARAAKERDVDADAGAKADWAARGAPK